MTGDDQWWRATPLNSEELKVERVSQLRVQKLPADQKFTCDECNMAPTCKLAFDMYNTGGDCLMEK